MKTLRHVCLFLLGWFVAPLCTWGQVIEVAPESTRRYFADTDAPAEVNSEDTFVLPATTRRWLQPQPPLLPEVTLPQSPVPSVLDEFSRSPFASGRTATLPGSRRNQALTPSSNVLFGLDSILRATSDAGNLFGKSPAAVGIGIQRRNPIVSDPRIRGSRVGRLAAAGSYWIPARIDLDTMLSKIDSRIIEDMIVIRGPYSTRYGPGFEFVDVELLSTPRFDDGFQGFGSSSLEYKTNGAQWYGREMLWGGGADWGLWVGYGHRTGSDYRDGTGGGIPSSYKSRDAELAFGYDLTPDSSLEFNYLRLDQTDVELPGQAFDIDFLVTDGFELEYMIENQADFDRLVIDSWYNRTRFEGSAQRAGKRQQFPFYDTINFVGNTDVDSMSTGFRAATTWGIDGMPQITAGADLRFIKQELNEITSGRIGLALWSDANSPIPRSQSINPGLFIELVDPITDDFRVTAGARVDMVKTEVIDDPAKLSALGLEVPQHSLAQILGTNEFDQNFTLASFYLTGDCILNDQWTATLAGGYAERPPTLTELYAAQPFMFLLQNGLNTVTGDPLLHDERLWQIDVGLHYDNGSVRGGVNGFHAWARDYITFENLRVLNGSGGHVEQVSLQYVNTALATLAGAEAYVEVEWNDWLTPFATMTYVEGLDHTRNGDFATMRATGGNSKMRVPGLPRGSFSTLIGGRQEPLPGIVPLESRIGLRIHDPSLRPRWLIEIATRLVDNQDRVAASLLETPTPGFTTWDARATWLATEQLLLVAGVENFGDRGYREHLDFRSANGIQLFQPGINFYFSTEITY